MYKNKGERNLSFRNAKDHPKTLRKGKFSVTKNRCFAILIASGLGLPLSACSSQSSTVAKPIWIANNINGLQGSTCHCGGIYPKKLTKAQKKAQRRAEKDAR